MLKVESRFVSLKTPFWRSINRLIATLKRWVTRLSGLKKSLKTAGELLLMYGLLKDEVLYHYFGLF